MFTLQITPPNLLSLFHLVFTIRFLATDLSEELSLQITLKSSCHFFFNYLGLPTLQNSTQLANSELLRFLTTLRFLWNFGTQLSQAIFRASYRPSARTTHRKHIHCPVTDVLLLSRLLRWGKCLARVA
jgi:hypothetical protein